MQNEPKQPAISRPRLHLMDELRGFAVFCMVFYHGFYTLAILYKVSWALILLRFFTPAEPFFAALFIFISGISSLLSHSNLKRGLRLLAISAAVTAVTVLVTPSASIWFGILHFLSINMILFGLLGKHQKEKPFLWPLVLLCGALYFFTKTIPHGYLGFGALPVIPLPAVFYQSNWLAPLGFYNSSFFSADYFPLLPWGFVFLAGTLVGRLVAQGRVPGWMYRPRIPFFSAMGRWALIIYIVHQPVIYAVCWLLWQLHLFG